MSPYVSFQEVGFQRVQRACFSMSTPRQLPTADIDKPGIQEVTVPRQICNEVEIIWYVHM